MRPKQKPNEIFLLNFNISQVIELFFIAFIIIGFVGCERSNDISEFNVEGYAGVIKGSFKVNQNGAATYRVPIVTPPGTRKMQPHLTLEYNSLHQNSYMGMGWTLKGLSTIQRTGATIARDGYWGSIQYNSKDRFILDGIRLMAVKGKYGADSTVYHTEHQSWSKVVSYGKCGSGPCGFQVTTKKGIKREYGLDATNTSRVRATGKESIRLWALNKITDTNGNYLTISYLQDSINGTCYPLKIEYTGNYDEKDRKILLHPTRKIEFSYDNQRPDSIPTFQGGSAIKTTRLLTNITSSVDLEKVLQYKFSYKISKTTGRSLLQNITLADAKGKSLPKTLFRWSEKDTTIYKPSRPLENLAVPSYAKYHPMDVNGDGKIDLTALWPSSSRNYLIYGVAISKGTGFEPVQIDTIATYYPGKSAMAMDINGDGLFDLAYCYEGISDGNLHYTSLLSNGKRFVLSESKGTGVSSYGDPQTSALDIDGNGLTDFVYTYEGLDDSKLVYTPFFSNGSGFTAGKTKKTSIGYGQLVTANLNGDVMGDLVYATQSSEKPGSLQLFSLISDGEKFVKSDSLTTKASWDDAHIMPMDINGDRLTDLCVNWTGGGKVQLSTFLSDGQNLQATAQSYIFPGFKPGVSTLLPADINGDGLADLIQTYTQGGVQGVSLTAYFSNGLNFKEGHKLSVAQSDWGQYSSIPLDINGDNKTDIINIPPDSNNPAPTLIGSNEILPDLITDIRNGAGGHFSVSYKPLTDDEVYTRTKVKGDTLGGTSFLNQISGASFPAGPGTGQQGTASTNGASVSIRDVDPPRHVVAGYIKFDGLGNSYPYGLHYSGGKVSLTGYGWLGFKSVTHIDSTRDAMSVMHYLQNFPLTGQVHYIDHLRSSDKKPITRQRSSYNVLSTRKDSGTVYRTPLVFHRTTHYDYDWKSGYTVGKNYYYDQYDNPTLEVDLGDVSSETYKIYRHKYYDNDPETWQLGYLLEMKTSKDSVGKLRLNDKKISYYQGSKNIQTESYWNNDNQGLWQKTSYTYDPFGNKVTSVDFSNDTIKYVYNAETYFTFASKKIMPPNQYGKKLESSYTHDLGFGNVIEKIDYNNIAHRDSLDGLGRPAKSFGPNDTGEKQITLSITNYKNDSLGGYYVEKLHALDWNEKSWHHSRDYFDGLHRNFFSESLNATGTKFKRVNKEFDSGHKIIRKSLPYFNGDTIRWSKRELDPAGRVVKQVSPKGDADSTVVIHQYRGKKTYTTEAVGTANSTHIINHYELINSKNTLVQKLSEKNHPTEFDTIQFKYDLLGRFKRQIDPQKLSNVISYNSLNRKKSVTDDSFGKTIFIHNDENRTNRTVYANGWIVTDSLDALGRVLVRKFHDNSKILYQYDLREYKNSQGKLSKVLVEEANGEKSSYVYSYDAHGNTETITFSVDGQSYTSQMRYLPGRLPREMTYPDGSILKYTYTKNNQLDSLLLDDSQDEQQGNFELVSNYRDYNVLDKPSMVSYGNQVVSNFEYYATGHLKKHQTKGKTKSLTRDSIFIDDSYKWSYLHQIDSIVDFQNTDYSQYFSYSKLGRLITADGIYGHKEFSYDQSGNIKKKDSINYYYNGYQLKYGLNNKKDTVYSASYDLVGNMKEKIQDSDTTHFTYNSKNQLESITLNREPLYSFRYDYQGKRIIKNDLVNNIKTIYVSPGYEIITNGNNMSKHTKYVSDQSGKIAAISTRGTELTAFVNHKSSISRINHFNTDESYGLWLFLESKISALSNKPGLTKLIMFWIWILLSGVFMFLFLLSYVRTRYRKFFDRSPIGLVMGINPFIVHSPIISFLCPLLFTGLMFSFTGCDRSNIKSVGSDNQSTNHIALYFIKNNTNSVSIVSDIQGKIQSKLIYEPYGKIFQHSGSDNFKPKFGGKEQDKLSGLYFFSSRYYDPITTRFTTADTHLASKWYKQDTFNRYAYALNNPINYIDPTGHTAEHKEQAIAWIDDFLEIGLGILLDILSFGALADTIGGTILGAGLGGLTYNIGAAVSENFTWKAWGASQAEGAIAGFGSAGAGAILGELSIDAAADGAGVISTGAKIGRFLKRAGGYTLGSITGNVVGTGVKTGILGSDPNDIGWSAMAGLFGGGLGAVSGGLINEFSKITTRLGRTLAKFGIAVVAGGVAGAIVGGIKSTIPLKSGQNAGDHIWGPSIYGSSVAGMGFTGIIKIRPYGHPADRIRHNGNLEEEFDENAFELNDM